MAVAERIEMADAPERDRYELSIDGELVGFTAYRARPGLIAFVHTEIDERLQGRGLADLQPFAQPARSAARSRTSVFSPRVIAPGWPGPGHGVSSRRTRESARALTSWRS